MNRRQFLGNSAAGVAVEGGVPFWRLFHKRHILRRSVWPRGPLSSRKRGLMPRMGIPRCRFCSG